MGKKLASLVLATELFAGVNNIAHAPGISVSPNLFVKQQIAKIDKNAPLDPGFEKAKKKMAEVAYVVELINEMATEQQIRLDPKSPDYDPLYSLVVQVYNSVKDQFGIPDYMTPEFFKSVITTESTNYQFAVSKAGAMGYTQMTPAAALEVGVSGNFKHHAFNAWDSINMSMAYFAWIDRKLASKYPGWEKLNDFEKLRDDADAYNMGWKGFLNECFNDKGKFTENYLPTETFYYFRKIMGHWYKKFPKSLEYSMYQSFPHSSWEWKSYLPFTPVFQEADASSKQYQQG